MNKQVEKIRAEIDRRYEVNREKARYDDYYRGMNDGLDHLERFIDSLTEQPSEGLDVTDFSKPLDPDVARAIADNLDYMYDEQPNKDLEEAAEAYTQRMLESWRFDSTGCRPPRESFIAGAKWQKEQMPMPEDTVLFQKGVEEGKRLMLEDAVDGECIDDTTAGVEIDTKYGVLFLPPKTFKYEDKVKIIIVKEDEK